MNVFEKYKIKRPRKVAGRESTIEGHCVMLLEYGFKREDLGRIFRLESSLLGSRDVRTAALLKNLEDYGFSRDDVVRVVVKAPAVLKFSVARTNAIFSVVEKHGISRERVVLMMLRSPKFIGSSIDRLDDLMDIFDEFSVDYVMHADKLIFSPKLIRARVRFLQSGNVVVSSKNLFLGANQFEKRYLIGREELIREWYDEVEAV